MAHAELSPSSSDRWINCPGSVLKSRGLEEPPSVYAEEGTRAHSVAEACVRGEMVEADADMIEHGEGYAAYVRSLNCDDFDLERRFDLTQWIPGGFGTADFTGVAGDTLHVVDYKYGQGVRVDAANNTQLMCYALGALNWWWEYYRPSTVALHIYQPRLGHVDRWDIDTAQLVEWSSALRKHAHAALQPGAAVVAGEWCRFCRARGICPEQHQQVLATAQGDFGTMTPEELAEAYGNIGMVEQWVKDCKAAAQRCRSLPGYKWVEGRSNRQWVDPDAAMAAHPELKTYKIIGITEAGKILPKDALAELLYKPAGKPVLVPESDKRPPADDFTNLGDEGE